MKKKFWSVILALVTALLLVVSLAACDNNDPQDDGTDDPVEELVPTEGLKYEVTEDKTGFCVTGIEKIDITELVIPATYLNKPVVAIGKNAFSSCVLLESIVIPDSVVSIGEKAFENTAYYEKASNWKSKVLYVGKHLIKAQDDISGHYYVKSGTITIADCAFWLCEQLTAVTIVDSVVTVGLGAFGYCSALENIDMGNSVVAIKQQAFKACSKLTSIEIPATLKTLEMWAFYQCTSLSDVYLHDIAAWCSVEVPLGDDTCNPLYYANNLYLNGELVTEIVIPDGVTAISKGAFAYLKTLTKVTIPKSVTKIGRDAFRYCTSLTEIYYGGTLNDWRKVDKGSEWGFKIGQNMVYCTDGYYDGGYHYYD